MTTRDKVAHLLRRFGLGASPEEMAALVPLGYEGALRRLVMDAAEPEPPAAPSEFFWRENEEADLGAWRVRVWWCYRLLTTRRPMQEKLALFWHSHFAVSDGKVEDGPMMLDYLRVLQTLGQGKFGLLLDGVAKNPAMMRYLDMTRSLRGNPNENWAREVMELFTLGIGNYTEDDVKEVARAFTGWGYIHTFWEMPGNADAKLKDSLKYDRPFSSFAYLPGMHDPGPKTILGKTAAYDGDDILKLLAKHPITARRIVFRLWEFFAYPDPEPAVVDRLARVFTKTDGDIRQVMLALGSSPEFLSDRCVRRLVKSPLDFMVPIARQMGMPEALAALRPPSAKPEDRIPQPLMDQAGYVAYLMERQGLSLLWPPDVAGWKWNEAWASPDTLAHRFSYRGLLLWGDNGPGAGGNAIVDRLKRASPGDPRGVVDALLEMFDAPPQGTYRAPMEKLWTDADGLKLVREGNPTWVLDRSLAILAASPEFQMA